MAKRVQEPVLSIADVLAELERFPWDSFRNFVQGMMEVKDPAERQKMVDVIRMMVPSYVKLNLELDEFDTGFADRMAGILLRPFEEISKLFPVEETRIVPDMADGMGNE